jgi:GAF domain-containing protein
MTALPPDVVTDLGQENAQLRAELRAARDRQNASAEILRAIAGSPGDSGRSLKQIAETSARLFGAPSVSIQLVEDGKWAEAYRLGDSAQRIRAAVPLANIRVGGRNMPGAVAGENRQIHIPDLDHLDPSMSDWPGLPHARAAGTRTMCGTPLRREGRAIGALIVYRDQLLPFTEEELALQQSFADQAVIAIENARLFNETQEALARQTATSEILRVINNAGGNLAPVFDCILENAHRLCGAPCGSLQLYEHNRVVPVAIRGMTARFTEFLRAGYPITEAIREGLVADHPVQRVDTAEFLRSHPDEPSLRAAVELGGIGTMVTVPLAKDGVTFGRIVAARQEVYPFTDKQIALLQGFADQAVIAIENARLFNETKEALERQTATAEILKVIASSPSDVQPVFEAIVNSAAKLFEPCAATIVTLKDEKLHWNATAALHPEFDVERARAIYPLPFKPNHFPSARAIAERRIVEIADSEAPDTSDTPRRAGRISGFRSATFVPLINGVQGIGTIILTHPQAGFKLSEKQLALVQTFADQAVIAIQNTRLFNETREALERQTATAEILKVIASSPSNVQPVFDVIVERAVRLCGGRMGRVYRYDGGVIQMVAGHGLSAPGLGKVQQVFPRPATDDTIAGQVMLSHRPYFVTDIQHDDSVPALSRQMIEALGTRSQVTVPMLRTGEAIGAITVGWAEPGAYGDQQVALLQTFADQGVIAIENVRLFNETKEALERQTATAEILKVIASSPSDVQPVFEAIAASTKRLIGGFSAAVFRFVDDVGHLAAFTPTRPAADEVWKASFPRRLSDFPPFEWVRGGEAAQIPDIEASPDVRDLGRLRGFRSVLVAPLMSSGVPIGMVSVTRLEPGSFADHHVQLLQTFADQAVIAIENVRLFNETKEALERQTATAEILKVIASSPSDVQPVFEAIATSANRLIGGFSSTVFRFIDGIAYLKAFTPTTPAADEVLKATFPRPVADFPPLQMAQAGEVTQVADTEALSDELLNISRARGFRSMLFAPLMNDGVSIGFIAVTRVQPGAFADHHVQLLRTFADQAVIAIENARLFEEVQAKTRDLTESLEQQTATSEVLEVISSSPGELQPVFQKMLENATRVCGANFGTMSLYDGDRFRNVALYNTPEEFAEELREPIRPHPKSGLATVARTHQAIQIEDLRTQPPYLEGDRAVIAMSDLAGARTIVIVPMLRENELVGTIAIYRREVRSFTDKQVDLVANFAKQAVIAIENTRLLNELRQRTDDLSESLQQQTATADVLKVISRSAFDLNAVFETVAESSVKLCGSDKALIFRFDGEVLQLAAAFNAPHDLKDWLERNPIRPGRHSIAARAALERRTVQVSDVLADPEHTYGAKDVWPFRTVLAVPMLTSDDLLGVILVYHNEVRQFTDKQIALVQTFADQAVIAIENVRLFEEVQARTRELSQSLDDLRTAQGRLIQTEKLASLGQLTAGIAHEIKNPLNFVNNFSALSAELTDELNDVLKSAKLADNIREEVDELTGLLKDNLEKVVQHGKRADSIVKNMLLHSREGSGDHRPADINALVDESLNLAYHGARAEKPQFNVTLQRNLDPNAGMIEVFPQEITRVFLNLISNGFYAVTRRKVENGSPDFEPVVRATTRNLGNTVEIRIRDNGTGIPAEVKEKMFNPFFTTKPAGEGTGLGLSMSHDIIVKQHGGTIDVDTEPGQFTEFRIVLPRTSNLSNKTRGQT